MMKIHKYSAVCILSLVASAAGQDSGLPIGSTAPEQVPAVQGEADSADVKGSMRTLWSRGVNALREGRYAESLVDLRAARGQEQESAELAFDTAMAAWRAGEFDEAETAADQAASLSDGELTPLREGLLGAIHYKRAQDAFRQALSPSASPGAAPGNPQDPAAGDPAAAVPDFASALGLSTRAENAFLRAALGDAENLRHARNYERALQLSAAIRQAMEDQKDSEDSEPGEDGEPQDGEEGEEGEPNEGEPKDGEQDGEPKEGSDSKKDEPNESGEEPGDEQEQQGDQKPGEKEGEQKDSEGGEEQGADDPSGEAPAPPEPSSEDPNEDPNDESKSDPAKPSDSGEPSPEDPQGGEDPEGSEPPEDPNSPSDPSQPEGGPEGDGAEQPPEPDAGDAESEKPSGAESQPGAPAPGEGVAGRALRPEERVKLMEALKADKERLQELRKQQRARQSRPVKRDW